MSGLKVDIGQLIPEQNTVAMSSLVRRPVERQFEIPFNQRPWVWKRENLRDLWTDLGNTVDRFFAWNPARESYEERPQPLGNPHYFGAFVFYKRGANTYEVVDGQQRLASVCMLAAVLRELAQEVRERTTDVRLRNEADGLAVSLTSWLQANPGAGIQRLRLDPAYDHLFRQYVIEPRSETDRAAAFETLSEADHSQRGQLQIKTGFDFLHRTIKEELESLTDGALIEEVRVLERTMGEAFVASQVVVDDEPFALSVFSGLNARGVPLSAADQIKNELFERTEKRHHQKIKDDWDAIVEALPANDIALFLRLRHLAFVDADCPRKELYFRVRDRELIPNDPTRVVAEWKRDAKLLSVLTTEKRHPAVDDELWRQLRTLHKTLRISYSWPLLLSAGRRFFPADVVSFRKLARLTLAFCFRVLTIGKADVLELERTVSQAALALTNQASLNDVARMLREASSDDEFREDFATVTLNRADVQFYSMYELEVFRANRAGVRLEPFPHSPKQNVEHILPQRLSKAKTRLGEWREWRSRADPRIPLEEHADYVNRLGNLLILEGDINRDVSNFDFIAKQTGAYPGGAVRAGKAKRKSYADSSLRLAADVRSRSSYRKWTTTTIDRRQERLADDAVKAWTLRLK